MDGRRVLGVVLLLATLAASCTMGSPTASEQAPEPTTPAPTTTTPAASTKPVFVGAVHPIDDATRARMTFSWHEGCPVPLEDLRRLTLTYWGFDDRTHDGEIVVHEDWASQILGVFQELFRARFPLRRVALADTYQGDDDKLMAADVTSGFNCREATGQPGVWSEHAYGRAVDVNPLENPYVAGDSVLPPAGRRYLDRDADVLGMIHEGDVVVRAFDAIGWAWGGHYQSVKDYQHFSATGR